MLLFNDRSQSRLSGVDPRLVQILNTTRERTGIPFEITEGLRERERQKQLVAAGKSQTMNSRHLHGNAADIHILNPDGSANWDFDAYRPIADVAKQVAAEMGYNDFVWGGDWKSLRDGVHFQIGGKHNPQAIAADTMSAIGKGDTAKTQEQPMGLLNLSTKGAAAPAEKEKWWTPDRRDSLQLALEGMTLNPNPGIMYAAQARMQGRREDKKAEQADQKDRERRERLAGWLSSRPGGQDYAKAILAGADPNGMANNYLRSASTAAKDPSVQSSQMLPDQSGTVMTMRDGGLKVLTVGGDELTGNDAVDYVRKAQEKAAEIQRSIYYARGTGSNQADMDTGGQAAATVEEGKMAPRTAKEFGDNASLVRSAISNIDNAIRAIDEGAETGMVYNMLPDITVESASLTNAMNRMGLDVIGSVTFGALSAAELRLAMETAAPRNLPPQELRKWLVDRREAQAKAYQAMIEAAQHFAGGGTQEEYYRMIGHKAQKGGQEMSDDDLLKKYGGQ